MSDGDEADPFERLDSTTDREGDPFERLDPDGENEDVEPQAGSNADESATGTDTGERGETPAAEEWSSAHLGDEPAAGNATTDETDGDTGEFRSEEPQSVGPDDPFSGIDDREQDPFESGEGAFERVDVEHIDADEVWEEIADGEDDTDDSAGDRYAEVSKHRYCEQCEFFSGPPKAHCTNEGTEIVEFLDMETVRLYNCPVVAEQHDLGSEE